MNEVGFSRFDAQKYQHCGIGRVKPQLIRHVDNDLRDFAEKDETLQRVVETFAKKLMRTGEATNTALSTLTDMMWCVLAVMYFAVQNNQIPSLHLNAGKDALEEAHKKLECQLQHCRKEYLSELTALRDRYRHFTPEMEATLLKCAKLEPTYFFATKHHMDEETAKYVEMVVEEKLKLSVLKGAHHGFSAATDAAERAARDRAEAEEALRADLDGARSRIIKLEQELDRAKRQLKEDALRELRRNRTREGDDADDIPTLDLPPSRRAGGFPNASPGHSCFAHASPGSGSLRRLKEVELPFPADTPNARAGKTPQGSAAKSRSKTHAARVEHKGCQCPAVEAGGAGENSSSLDSGTDPSGAGAQGRFAGLASGAAHTSGGPQNLSGAGRRGAGNEDPRVAKLEEENTRLKVVIEDLQLRLEQLVDRLRSSGLGGAGLDEFLKSTGLAAVLEQRKMLEVFERLYADAEARRVRAVERKERFRLLEETDLLKILSFTVESLEASKILKDRGWISAPEGGFNRADPGEASKVLHTPSAANPTIVSSPAVLDSSVSTPSLATPPLRAVPLTPSGHGKAVLPALDKRMSKSFAELRAVFECSSRNSSVEPVGPASRRPSESPGGLRPPSASPGALRRSFGELRGLRQSAESTDALRRSFEPGTPDFACYGTQTTLQRSGSTPAWKGRKLARVLQ